MPPLNLNKIANGKKGKTTYSGYSKEETYSLLLKSILTSDVHSCCYVSAELLCTTSELNGIFVFIIDALCVHYHSYNTHYISELVLKLNALSSLSRRNIQRNPHAQQYLCEIVILLSTFLKEKNFHNEYIERYSSKMNPNIESELYAVKLLDDIHNWVHTLFKEFPFEIQRYLHILYKFIKSNDKQQTIQFANFLLVNSELQGLVTQYEINYEIDNANKTDKNDIAMILWKFILQYAEQKMQDQALKTYISNLYYLYVFNYTKQKRPLRIMMLYNALLSIMTPTLFKNKSYEKTTLLIEEAKSKIYIIYDEIIGPQVLNAKHTKHTQHTKPPISHAQQNISIIEPPEKKVNNMDYLKMCIWGEDE